jgi:hypothetical protein
MRLSKYGDIIGEMGEAFFYSSDETDRGDTVYLMRLTEKIRFGGD